MKKLSLSILLFTFLVVSMSSFKTDTDKSDELIGVWVESTYKNEVTEYVKADTFKADAPGIEFIKNGQLKKRQNSAWCGTPPISYKNEEGFWKFTSNSTLAILYKYWGGTMEEDWEIIALSNQTLRIKRTAYRRESDKRR